MARAAATVMAGQCGQVGQGQCVGKVDASTKVMALTITGRTLATKEMDGNFIPPGDAAQRNGTNNGGGRASDNDDVE